jgi:4-hydroxymandelate oxidase
MSPAVSREDAHVAVEIADLINLFDFEPIARASMTPMAFEYLSGGGGDEITLLANRERFDTLRLKTRVLRDVSAIDTSVSLLGRRHPFPIVLAPCGYHGLFHESGERGTARGAAEAGATFVVSTVATTSLVEVAKAASGPRWFQMYVRDRERWTGRTRRVERPRRRRAHRGGAGARVTRPRARASSFRRLRDVNLPSSWTATGRTSTTRPEDHLQPVPRRRSRGSRSTGCARTRSSRCREGRAGPRRTGSHEHGAAAIVVSNHGGRNLDTTPATIDALPEVVVAVSGRVPVLMDGGIRRGTDVIKALALGASAVLIGRPYLWGLAAAGDHGVTRVVEILRREFETAMALCGVTRLGDIDRGVLWREPIVRDAACGAGFISQR